MIPPLTEDRYSNLEVLDQAWAVGCPRCGADRDEGCTNTITGERMRTLHWQRVRAAMTAVSAVQGATAMGVSRDAGIGS